MNLPKTASRFLGTTCAKLARGFADTALDRHSFCYIFVMSSPMNSAGTEDLGPERRIRIVRPAFQDLHLVMPRLSGRAQLRRHAMKLRWWRRGDTIVCDVDCNSISPDFFELVVHDDFGVTDGMRIIFCEESTPEPNGTIWVLSVMKRNEPLSAAALDIIFGRRAIVRERTNGWLTEDYDRP